MHGFFEHQYLTYKKNHIKNLLALAKADGFVHEKEQKMLFKISKRYGLKERQVQELMDSNEKFTVNVRDNFHDKMNVLFDLMQMVWADGVIEKKEIEFCEALVKKFGMKKDIVKWLIHEVFEKGTTPPPDEWEEIKREAKEKFVTK
ncbi:MAG TPA: hypothetical protein DGG95_03795 [Cytophagales bacterium]|nr:hypothetical protein [Cytophagales bacterium]